MALIKSVKGINPVFGENFYAANATIVGNVVMETIVLYGSMPL